MTISSLTQTVLNATGAYSDDAELRRANAVAAALEVIAARASGGGEANLIVEFNKLSTYADQIQEALKI